MNEKNPRIRVITLSQADANALTVGTPAEVAKPNTDPEPKPDDSKSDKSKSED